MSVETDSRAVFRRDSVRGGSAWSHVLKRGTSLRITDTEGGANVGAVFLNFDVTAERYNMPDTLKAQHTAHLTKGHVLYSDMGRILVSITDDSCGWHDPIGGLSRAETVRAKYGEGRYQQLRNDFFRNAHDNFVTELQKFGLSLRDLPISVNFFSKVQVAPDGSLHFASGHSKAGDFVELRAEMNTLVILDTCQHPLDPAPGYSPRPIELEILAAGAVSEDDPCRILCPENGRGFMNTENFFL